MELIDIENNFAAQNTICCIKNESCLPVVTVAPDL